MRRARNDLTRLPDIALAGLAPFAAFVFFFGLSLTLRDGDTGWHLATGEWILAHRSVPSVDPFSFTATGRPWVAHEWLSEIVMYLAYRGGGWAGLVLLFAAALASLYAIVTLHLLRWLSVGGAALALLYLSIGLTPFLLARPHLLALPLLAGWLIALLRAREGDRAPSRWLAVLMLVWANAHGSFLLGLALAGLFGLEALITAPRAARIAVIRDWGIFGCLSLAAGLCTPGGVGGLLYPLYVSNLSLLPLIVEWHPANFAKPSGFEVVLLSALFFMLFRPARIPWLRLLLLIGVLHLGLEHMRQQMVMLVVGAIVLAEPIGRAWADATSLPRASLPGLIWIRRRELAPLLGVTAALFAGIAAWRMIVPLERPDSYGVPAAALRHISPSLAGQPVFNEYSFGGLLILNHMRPYIDGRSDMYGDAFTTDYAAIARGDAGRWRVALAKWKFTWTILPPDNPLVPILDRQAGWHRLHADKWAVIHVAEGAATPQAGTRAR